MAHIHIESLQHNSYQHSLLLKFQVLRYWVLGPPGTPVASKSISCTARVGNVET